MTIVKFESSTAKDVNEARLRRSGANTRRRKMVGSVGGGEESFNLATFVADLEVDSDNEIFTINQDTDRLLREEDEDQEQGQNLELEAADENVWSISVQMFIPFLLAGFGMVAASLLLDVVQVVEDFG